MPAPMPKAAAFQGTQTIRTVLLPATDFEQSLLACHNAERERRGLAKLILNPILSKRSQEWSQTQARAGRLYHSPNGLQENVYGTPATWSDGTPFTPTAQGIIDAYMQSPGHAANVLNPQWRSVGFGIASGPAGTYSTTQFSP